MPSSHEGAFELGTDGPKSILVGVDGSTTATRAAWYATGLARRQGAAVTAVFVIPIAAGLGVAGGGAALEVARQESAEQEAADMRRRAADFSREIGVPIAFVTAHGEPFTEICRIAEEIQADAVVVGASAHAGHRLIGSLAVRLVRAARWPVTVVP